MKGADGKVVSWMIEGGSPNALLRRGITKETACQVGMELTIEGYRAKDATNKAVGRNFVLPGGKRLFVGGGATPDAAPAAPDAAPAK